MNDIQLAEKVPYDFLPEGYEDDRVAVASTLRSLIAIRGNFCSIVSLDDYHLLVCTCDALGHGVSAALFAARINTYVPIHAPFSL